MGRAAGKPFFQALEVWNHEHVGLDEAMSWSSDADWVHVRCDVQAGSSFNCGGFPAGRKDGQRVTLANAGTGSVIVRDLGVGGQPNGSTIENDGGVSVTIGNGDSATWEWREASSAWSQIVPRVNA